MFVSFSTDVYVVNVGCFFLVWGNGNGRGNCGFGHLLHFYAPFIFWFFEIAKSEFRLSVRNNKVDSVFAEYSVHFWDHFVGIGCGVLSALCGIRLTRTESSVALSTTASKEASGKSIAFTSMRRYLKLSPFSLYFSFIAFTQTFEMSTLVMVL